MLVGIANQDFGILGILVYSVSAIFWLGLVYGPLFLYFTKKKNIFRAVAHLALSVAMGFVAFLSIVLLEKVHPFFAYPYESIWQELVSLASSAVVETAVFSLVFYPAYIFMSLFFLLESHKILRILIPAGLVLVVSPSIFPFIMYLGFKVLDLLHFFMPGECWGIMCR